MKGKFKYNRVIPSRQTLVGMMMCWLLLSPVWLRAGDVELIRTIQKTFRVSETDVLALSNKYGKVNVNTWTKDYVSVNITITAYGPNEEIAQRRMEGVKIDEERTSGRILLVTKTSEDPEVRLDKKGVSVSYDVNLPAANPVKLENHFGNVFISDRVGDIDLRLSNGNVAIGRLQGKKNKIMTSFGQADLAYIEGGMIQCSYGHLLIGEAGDLSLKSDGAEVKMNEARTLKLVMNLGNLEIQRIQEISGQYSSGNFYLGYLEQSLSMQVKYAANFEVDHVGAACKSINLEASYCPVDLVFDPSASFQLEADVKYGKLRYEAPTVSMTILEDEVEGHSSTYIGRFGIQSSPKTKVTIKSQYGNVSIRQ